MQFLPVPKIMKWPRNLEQHYAFDRDILITSGCSFTACTMTLDCAASWPGYVRDRNGFLPAMANQNHCAKLQKDQHEI